MPPLFTSTSLTTLVRKITSAARQAQVNGSSRTLKRARLGIRKAIHHTFPSLGTPYHSLGYAVSPISIYKNGSSPSRMGHSFNRFKSTSMAFRTAYRLPLTSPSGAHVVGQVGLGSARGFASGPASNVSISNVPIGFRALVKLIDQDNENGNILPRPKTYRPYRHPKQRRLRRNETRAVRGMRTWSHCSSIDSGTSEMSHYFPWITRSTIYISEPISVEKVVTPGKATTLSLPLSPDLHALLDPTPTLTYAQAEIGVSVLADLCQHALNWEEAFDLYRQYRLNPILAQLDQLGLLRGEEMGSSKTEGRVDRDPDGRPDILRLVFYDRSIEDVRRLLGDSLKENEDGRWWDISEVDQRLTPAEAQDISGDWESQQAPETSEVAAAMAVTVVLPTLDIGDIAPSTPSVSDTSLPPTPVSNIYISSDGYSTPSDLSFSSALFDLNESIPSSWFDGPTADDIEVESAADSSAPSNVWSMTDEMPPSPSSFSYRDW